MRLSQPRQPRPEAYARDNPLERRPVRSPLVLKGRAFPRSPR